MWLFRILAFKLSSSRQAQQKSLAFDTHSASPGCSFTRWAGITDFGSEKPATTFLSHRRVSTQFSLPRDLRRLQTTKNTHERLDLSGTLLRVLSVSDWSSSVTVSPPYELVVARSVVSVPVPVLVLDYLCTCYAAYYTHCACVLENAPTIPELSPFLSIPYYSQNCSRTIRPGLVSGHVFLIASVFSGSALIPSASMMWPRNVILVWLNSHFCGFRVAPASSICLRTASSRWSCSAWSFPRWECHPSGTGHPEGQPGVHSSVAESALAHSKCRMGAC